MLGYKPTDKSEGSFESCSSVYQTDLFLWSNLDPRFSELHRQSRGNHISFCYR